MVVSWGLKVPHEGNWIGLSDNNLVAHRSRGIDVVRNKIKMFAQQKVTLPKGRHKIIILDEADR